MQVNASDLAGKEAWYNNIYLWIFCLVFLFRYVRAVVNFIGYSAYRPVPIPKRPSYFPADVTVVIPTTSINTETFHKVINSILVHSVSAIIIPTAGNKVLSEHDPFKRKFTDPRIKLLYRDEPNRREQTAMAVDLITTSLMIISDDHTFWPGSPDFLPSLLAPFERAKVGAVGPVLEARHHHHPLSWTGFWNFMGMTYLLRRAHEFLATNTIDGGISCLSSRFAVFRTCIYAAPDFKYAYLNDIFRGQRLNADDDKFHTAHLKVQGWEIKIQGGPKSVMTTELGEWPKFMGQCVRWTRTTFRSNPQALFEPKTWTRFPYTTYAIFIYSFVRMSLFHEILLFWLLKKTLIGMGHSEWFGLAAWILFLWCTGMKLVKLFPHFKKHPSDLAYFPAYLIFGWFSSFVKVYAMFTCGNTFWATAEANKAEQNETAPLLGRIGGPQDAQVIVGLNPTDLGIVTPENGRSDDESDGGKKVSRR